MIFNKAGSWVESGPTLAEVTGGVEGAHFYGTSARKENMNVRRWVLGILALGLAGCVATPGEYSRDDGTEDEVLVASDGDRRGGDGVTEDDRDDGQGDGEGSGISDPEGPGGGDGGEPDPDPDPDPDRDPEPETLECGDERVSHKVYYGTREPTYLPLTPGQVMAVGNFYGCTGTLIAPNWVLTASHCGVGRGSEICFGEDPRNATRCFAASAGYEPRGDMALLDMGRDITAAFPGIQPIPLFTDELTQDWIGRTAEAGGYGQQENGQSNEREFTAEPIYSISGDLVSIDGEGRRGVCFGDSGGPLMVIASDGTVRIAGVLSHGDPSCLGVDNYTRVDVYRDFIEGHTGPTVVEGARCGDISGQGRCVDGRAMWCANEELVSESCESSCGWDQQSNGFRCIQAPDPCQGTDNYGACQGEVAVWCENGERKRRDCGACDQVCDLVRDVGGYYCTDDPCRGTDYHGRCNDDLVEYCKDGEFRTRDCGSEGLRCGWVNDDLGNWCL
jgi:hypothetical protein